MSLIPSNRPLSDEQIKNAWFWALRLKWKTSNLGKRLAFAVCDELEAAGVNEADIDRIERAYSR